MRKKQRAKELEKELMLGKKSEDCNDFDLHTLLEVNQLLMNNVSKAQKPREEFVLQLRESIASERAKKQNRMKLPKFSMPNWQFSFTQHRFSAAIASVLLVAVVVTATNLFPFGGARLNKFNPLILDQAYAQENFTVTATQGDAAGIGKTTGFTITSIQSISLKDLRDNILLSPEAEFTLTQIDNHTFNLQPHTELEDGLVYTVTIASSYLNAAAQLQSRDYSWAFQVQEPFKVLHTLPRDLANGVPLNSGIEFTFSHQDIAGMQEAFSITPQVEGTFKTYGRTVVFVPKSTLSPSTIYTVALKDTVQIQGSDKTLLEPVSFQFETAKQASGEKFGISEDIIEFAQGDQIIFPVWKRHDFNSTVDVKVYSFKSIEQYTNALQERLSIPRFALASRTNHKIDTKTLNEVSTSTVTIEEHDSRQIILLPDELSAGMYLVDLQGQQMLLQISDLAVYTAVTDTDSIVWVNDTQTRKPVAGAEVKSVDGRLHGVTNSEGIVTFGKDEVMAENTNPYNVSDFIIVSKGNKVTSVRFGASTNYYYRDSFDDSAKYWNYLYTDRSMYRPTDTVQFWGFVKERDGDFPKEIRAVLTSDSYYNYRNETVAIYEATIPVSFGAFEGQTSFSRLTPGSYTLSIYNGDKLIEKRYLSVYEFEKPAYELTIDSDRIAGFAGEEFSYDINASFFEGTPVSNLRIIGKSSVTDPSVNLVLNEDGKTTYAANANKTDCNNFSDRCLLVTTSSLYLRPELGELGEITATAQQLVFNSKVFADVKTTRSEEELISMQLNTFNVDLDKINEQGGRYYIEDDFRGDIAKNVTVRGQITEVTYTREEVGQFYDFINKVHTPRYQYSTNRKIVDTFSRETDANGLLTISYQGDEDKTYTIEMIVEDGTGGAYSVSTYSYGASRYRSSYDYPYVNISNVKDTTVYTIGETAEFIFEKNEEAIIPDSDDAFLFLKLKQGLSDYEVTNNGKYSFVFSENDIPNVTIGGVYFDGTSYKIAGDSFYGGTTSARLNTEGRELDIQITTDKQAYEPGEEVRLNVQVRNANNEPVQAAVNINLVDEAYYALRNEAVDPLSVLYANVASGMISITETHKYRSLSALIGGAEGGGCFLVGTQILMEDGTTKSIEEIVAGDRILTRSSELSNTLIGATVKQTFVHDVNEYMILNDKIRVTPEHRMFINYGWQMVGDAHVGDLLIDTNGFAQRIDSIEWQREPVTVYNFEVEDLHTYFADGVYVHNDKGGVREDFADTALFDSVITDANGNASLTFELPDNITSWRITAQGITPNLAAGKGVTPLLATKPLFANIVLADEFLASDKPEIKVRAFGSGISAGQDVEYSLSSESLSLNQSIIGKAFTSTYTRLSDLSDKIGKHDLLTSIKAGEYTDAVKLSFSVINSRVTETEKTIETLTTETSFADKATASLVFSDATRGQYYLDTLRIAYTGGGRADREVAQIVGRKLLATQFSSPLREFDADITPFTTNNGMISLLPYSDAELALTVKIADANPELLDSHLVTSNLYQILDNKKSTNEEIAQALYGLAALGEPVLIPIQKLQGLEEQSIQTRLYTTLALAEIGDRENARKLYIDLLQQYGETNDVYTRLRANSDMESLEMTALATVIAAKIQDPIIDKLWRYTSQAHVANIITPLEQALFLSEIIQQLPQSDSAFTISINGIESEIDMSNGNIFELRLSEDQAKTTRITSITGSVELMTLKQVESDGEQNNNLVSIKREYRNLKGEIVTEFKEGDILEVLITPLFSSDAPGGAYVITDLVPSGLDVVTKPRRFYSNKMSQSLIRYPYLIQGQEVKFTYYDRIKQTPFKYFVRVTLPGEYTAEPARIEHVEAPEISNYSKESIITITK